MWSVGLSPGYKNLFCRDVAYAEEWADTQKPYPKIDFEAYMCLVAKGGPVNVAGDLTFFFKLKEHSDPGREVTVEVKQCTVVMHNVMGRDVTYRDQEFAFGPLQTGSSRDGESRMVHYSSPNSVC
jgi:hypothetical protein